METAEWRGPRTRGMVAPKECRLDDQTEWVAGKGLMGKSRQSSELQ